MNPCIYFQSFYTLSGPHLAFRNLLKSLAGFLLPTCTVAWLSSGALDCCLSVGLLGCPVTIAPCCIHEKLWFFRLPWLFYLVFRVRATPPSIFRPHLYSWCNSHSLFCYHMRKPLFHCPFHHWAIFRNGFTIFFEN